MLYYSLQCHTDTVLAEVTAQRDLDSIHLLDRNLAVDSEVAVLEYSRGLSLGLNVDALPDVPSWQELPRDSEHRLADSSVPFVRVGYSLHEWYNDTSSLNSGAVKVKVPSFGMFTPLPLLRHLEM